MYPKVRESAFSEEEEEHIHSKRAREKWVDDDILKHEDDGFMEGYEQEMIDEEENYCKFADWPLGKV